MALMVRGVPESGDGLHFAIGHRLLEAEEKACLASLCPSLCGPSQRPRPPPEAAVAAAVPTKAATPNAAVHPSIAEDGPASITLSPPTETELEEKETELKEEAMEAAREGARAGIVVRSGTL